jgi:hypothetical protein
MSKLTILVLGMLVWAALLIASSCAFRGGPKGGIGDWIDAALYILMGTFFVTFATRAIPARPRCRA